MVPQAKQVQGLHSNSEKWVEVCTLADLIPCSGVCVLAGHAQVAIFYLPDHTPPLYAVANRDPIGQANVLSRGIVGDIGGEPVVASPLYKQHFSLVSGLCLEQEDIAITTYAVRLQDERVLLDGSMLV